MWLPVAGVRPRGNDILGASQDSGRFYRLLSDVSFNILLERLTPGLRSVLGIWFSQVISLMGTGLTKFAIAVWLFQKTGSVTLFTILSVCAHLPGLLMAPLAGALVDRWDRKRVILASDSAAALSTLILALLIANDRIEIWHVYIFISLASLFNTFQLPAVQAAVTLLVPKDQFGRASGMFQLAQATAGTLAPVLAGSLLVIFGMTTVLIIDLVTFACSLVLLLRVRIPSPPISDEGRNAHGSILQEALSGWKFIRERPGLFGLLVYFAMVNLVLSQGNVLVTPLVLSFASEAVLGTVLSAGAAGFLAGTIYLTVTGGPRPHIHGVLRGGFVVSAMMVLVGWRPSALQIGIALFFMVFVSPIVNGSHQAIWQRKVPPDIQGRVFAVRRLLSQVTAPIGFLIAGPLADRVFEPLMAEDGALADSVGQVIGVGPGRGIGLIFLSLAILPVLISLWGYSQPRIRYVEDELPDAVQ